MGTGTDDMERSTETRSLTTSTAGRISGQEVENSPSVSVTSEEFARQIMVITDTLTQRLAHLCKFMRELKDE